MPENELTSIAADTPGIQNDHLHEEVTRTSIFKRLLINALVIYAITRVFRRSTDSSLNPQNNHVKTYAHNLYNIGNAIDIYLYLSDIERNSVFHEQMNLLWFENNIIYGDWKSGPKKDGSYNRIVNFDPPRQVLFNGSLYLHLYIVPSGRSPNPKDKSYSELFTIHKVKNLVKFKRRKFKKTISLLGDNNEAQKLQLQNKEKNGKEIIGHWHPNVTIIMVVDESKWNPDSLPPPLDNYIQFTLKGDAYEPVVFFSDYWNLMKDYFILDPTVQNLNVSLTFQQLSHFKWQFYAALEMRNHFTPSFLVDDSDDEQDTMKEVMLETSPYLLGLTVILTLIHSIFEFFTFKNDIQFWKNKESLEGLSVYSVFFNVFQSTVLVLYIFDNDTNTMVQISVLIGLIIDIWKITKVCITLVVYAKKIIVKVIDIRKNKEELLFKIIPKIKFQDKGSYSSSGTKEYDTMAFKYLGWIAFPLLFMYACYSLIYHEYKGWYSWILSVLYGFLLTFGFIMMTPQLFINYKLKSVAHLPWRMMTYKALNTFIDDIFAYIIRMPTLQRLGCLRDDVIFFIFLYQRWIYRVDPKRTNEFGFSKEMENKQDIEKKHSLTLYESNKNK